MFYKRIAYFEMKILSTYH